MQHVLDLPIQHLDSVLAPVEVQARPAGEQQQDACDRTDHGTVAFAARAPRPRTWVEAPRWARPRQGLTCRRRYRVRCSASLRSASAFWLQAPGAGELIPPFRKRTLFSFLRSCSDRRHLDDQMQADSGAVIARPECAGPAMQSAARAIVLPDMGRYDDDHASCRAKRPTSPGSGSSRHSPVSFRPSLTSIPGTGRPRSNSSATASYSDASSMRAAHITGSRTVAAASRNCIDRAHKSDRHWIDIDMFPKVVRSIYP